jgi:hypothetical protein
MLFQRTTGVGFILLVEYIVKSIKNQKGKPKEWICPLKYDIIAIP